MIDGFLLVDKPAGWTSHQVVGRARRLLGTRKVGHAGTLDPAATGLLLLGVGRATRLLGYLAGHDKGYTATIRFGISTTTEDADGEIVDTPGCDLSPADVATVAPRFIGPISQVPSAVSAIKVDGRRAYDRVRAGEDVVLAARTVTISRLDVLDGRRETVTVGEDRIDVLDADVAVDCSSGTYIRALARDLGERLGTAAHVTRLRRVWSGPFRIADAVRIDEPDTVLDPSALLDMADVVRRCLPTVDVPEQVAVDIGYGRAVHVNVTDVTAMIGPTGTLLALYRPDDDGGAVAQAVFVGGPQ